MSAYDRAAAYFDENPAGGEFACEVLECEYVGVDTFYVPHDENPEGWLILCAEHAVEHIEP